MEVLVDTIEQLKAFFFFVPNLRTLLMSSPEGSGDWPVRLVKGR